VDPLPAASPRPSAPVADRGGTPPWVRLVAGREPEQPSKPLSTRGVVVRLGAGLAAVLVVIALLAVFAAQWLAEREAVNDAANVTDVLADAVIRPALTDELADGDAAAVEAFDAIVRDQILGDDILRVKIWNPEGTVLYADEPQLIGRTFDLDDAQREALERPSTRAAVSDLSEEENEFETGAGSRLLEVYRPVWAPDGRQLLFEVYLPYEPVAARSAELRRGFAGVTTSSMLLLVVLTAPIVWGLLARLRRGEARRAELLQHAVEASDIERRRIAGTLHDGPVQELVATSFAAESAADAASRRGDDSSADRLREVAGAVRGNIRVLRSLLVDIYPESLTASGLAHALQDLGATARTRGVEVDVDVRTPLDDLSEAQERLIYRVTQETVRNAVTHAAPCAVRIHLSRVESDIVLEVADDGPGFDPELVRRPPTDGHLGTRVLVDLARQEGAELSLATAAGAGTRWRVRLSPNRTARETE
jgi:two-component system, NarL family, sensor kinase